MPSNPKWFSWTILLGSNPIRQSRISIRRRSTAPQSDSSYIVSGAFRDCLRVGGHTSAVYGGRCDRRALARCEKPGINQRAEFIGTVALRALGIPLGRQVQRPRRQLVTIAAARPPAGLFHCSPGRSLQTFGQVAGHVHPNVLLAQ